MAEEQTDPRDEKIAALEHRLAIMEDKDEIRSLQYAYGYYLDKCLYDEAASCFSERARLKFMNGVYVGQKGVRRLYCDWFANYFADGKNGPPYGLLLDHFLGQAIISVAPDRKTARGRYRALLQGGTHESRPPIEGFPPANWEGGIYEHVYYREDGVWKIGEFNYFMLWQADYHEGWDKSVLHLKPFDTTYPENPIGPDELTDAPKPLWPHTQIVPFHYPHPVTKEPWTED